MSCTDQLQQEIIWDNSCQQIIYGKTFTPYQQLVFTVSIEKLEVTFSATTLIQIIEFQIPSLTVKGVDQNKEYNYNDELIYLLIYPNTNPDLLSYACQIIYNEYSQVSFMFHYTEIKIKLLDYFTVPNEELGSSVKVRLSVYDPRYMIPSANTQTLTMHVPPQSCLLTIEPITQVEFLDQYNITVANCFSSDKRLLYSVYLNFTSSNNNNTLPIITQQLQNTLSFPLPYFNESVLIVQVQDSQGGIKTLATPINLRELKNISETVFTQFLGRFTTLDQKLLGYRIVVVRLQVMQNLQELKESLFRQLISFDKNQSLLSNQTESLYHSISLLVDQNFTLISINESNLLQQLSFRSFMAGQELFSQSIQSAQKQNYVNQCYSFLRILSAIIQYRTSQNQSAQDVLNQLESIISKLQDISIVNEPLIKLNNSQINFNFGYLTSKMLNKVTGISIVGDKFDSLSNLQYNTSTQLYKFSLTLFRQNPYESSQNSFRYQAFHPLIETNNTYLIGAKLNKPIKFSFKLEGNQKNNTLKCIQQVQQNEWSENICLTEQKENEIICICQRLFLTTLFQAKEIDSRPSPQIFQKIKNNTTNLFYLYVSVTGLYFIFLLYAILVQDQKIQKGKEVLGITLNNVQRERAQLSDNNIQPEHIHVRLASLQDQSDSNMQFINQKNNQLINVIPNGSGSFANQQSISHTELTKLQAYCKYLKNSHQILNLFYKFDENIPRFLRGTIVYIGIIGNFLMIFIFKQLIQGDDLMTLAIAAATAPLNKIYLMILEQLLGRENLFIKFLGLVLLTGVAEVITYIFLTERVFKTEVNDADWLFWVFLISMIFDNFIYSPIQLGVQFCLHINSIPCLQCVKKKQEKQYLKT